MMKTRIRKTAFILATATITVFTAVGSVVAAPVQTVAAKSYESAQLLPTMQSTMPLPETIEIGLSTETIAITSNFGGATLTIFGALDNADPLIQRQGRYDVIVVLQGPQRDLVVREKARYFGVWVNADSETFLNVPLSYSLASTRALQDITDPRTYRQLSLGVNHFAMVPEDSSNLSPTVQKFEQELREIKTRQGLYSQRIGSVEFVSQTLFRATLTLPANVPVGRHKVRALLFRHGVFLREANTHLEIVKAGFEQTVYEAAHRHSLAYGLFAVFLAGITGWIGQLLFRKD